jgi:hypothetical protein
MPNFKIGDRVRHKGEEYFITCGPTIAALGMMYELSKVPPPIRVIESEIEPVTAEG